MDLTGAAVQVFELLLSELMNTAVDEAQPFFKFA